MKKIHLSKSINFIHWAITIFYANLVTSHLFNTIYILVTNIKLIAWLGLISLILNVENFKLLHFCKEKKNLEAKYCIIRKIQVFENAKSQISNLII